MIRKPNVENKYNLKPKDITRAIILKPESLTKPPFWRNNVVQAWCLSESSAQSKKDWEYGTYNEYWIGFYDQDAKTHKGKIRLDVSAFGGMCNYKFNTFFNPKDIKHEDDLLIQEKLLARINWLIDEGIVEIPRPLNEHLMV